MQRRASLIVAMVDVSLAMCQQDATNALAIVSCGYGERRVAHVDNVGVGFGLHQLLHTLGSIVNDRFVNGCHRAAVQVVYVRVELDKQAHQVGSISLL